MAAQRVAILVVVSLLCFSAASADRAHGLATESPMAISPEAYAFFHPHAAMQPSPSTIPLAATVKSTPAHESASPGGADGHRGIGAGGIAGICLSIGFVCAVAGVGAYYVVKKRRGGAAGQPVPTADV